MDFADVTVTNRALVKVAKLYRAAQSAALSEIGLHPGQDVLIWVLGQAPDGMLISEIADRLDIETPTVTRSLARIDGAGFYVREQVPDDRRAVRIRLTDAGRAILPGIEAAWQKLADTATAGFADDEREQLVTLLNRVRENLSTSLTSGGNGHPDRRTAP